MTPALSLQIITIVADAMIIFFVGFYIFSLQKDARKIKQREEELSKKEAKIADDYKQIIQNAQNQVRKILDDATKQANTIITNSQYISNSYKDTLDKAFQKIVVDIQNQAASSSSDQLLNYKNFLNQVSQNSLTQYQNTTKKFEQELQIQMQQFRDTLLPTLQHELEEHKKKRFMEADKKIDEIIQKVAQKVFNKSLSYEDHKNLIIESLEKSQKEGLFD